MGAVFEGASPLPLSMFKQKLGDRHKTAIPRMPARDSAGQSGD